MSRFEASHGADDHNGRVLRDLGPFFEIRSRCLDQRDQTHDVCPKAILPSFGGCFSDQGGCCAKGFCQLRSPCSYLVSDLPLAITASIRPNSLAALFTQAFISSGFPMSTAEPMARAPFVAPLKSENSSPRMERAQKETFAPSARKSSTIDLPMPFEPPFQGSVSMCTYDIFIGASPVTRTCLLAKLLEKGDILASTSKRVNNVNGGFDRLQLDELGILVLCMTMGLCLYLIYTRTTYKNPP